MQYQFLQIQVQVKDLRDEADSSQGNNDDDDDDDDSDDAYGGA